MACSARANSELRSPLTEVEYAERMNTLASAFVKARSLLSESVLLGNESMQIEARVPGLLVLGSMGAGPRDSIKSPSGDADFDIKPIINISSSYSDLFPAMISHLL